jgi:Cof subfamily protein (haloacid dehalogenase superfamily)
MKVKLVAFDLDGTLLNEHAEIADATRHAIHRLAQCGVIVTIATGRVFTSAAYFAHQLGINVPLITCDGALVKESNTGYEHYHKKVPLDLAKEIAVFADEYDVYLRCYIGDIMYVDRNWEHASRISHRLRIQAQLVDSLKDFIEEEPTLISITEPAEKFNRYFQPLHDKFHDRLTLNRFTASAGASGLGIIHQEASKGKALAVLAEHLDVRKEEIMAFGDDLNDIGLFEGAGYKVAMGNAEKAIKELSDYVCGTNRENGVAIAIDQLIIPGLSK